MRSAHAISRPSLEAKDYARLSLCGVASIEQSQMEAGQGRERSVGWAVSQKKGYTAGAGSQRLKPATRRRRSRRRRQHANSPQEPAGHWQHAAGAATIIPLWPCNPFAVSTVSTLSTVLLLVQCACRTSCHYGCECSTWCGRRSICRFRVSFLFLFLFSV